MSSVIDKTEEAIKNKPIKLDKGDRNKLIKLDKNAKWKDIKNVKSVNDAISDLDIYEERVGLGCSRYLQEVGQKGTYDKEEMFRNCREADIVKNRVDKKKKRDTAQSAKGRKGRGGGVGNDKKLLQQNKTITDKTLTEKPKEISNYKKLSKEEKNKLKDTYNMYFKKHTTEGNTNWGEFVKDYATNIGIMNCLNQGLDNANMLLSGITQTIGNVANAYAGYENGKWYISNDIYKGLTDLVKNCGLPTLYMSWLNWKNIYLWIKGGELPNEGTIPPRVNPNPNIGGGGGGDDDDDDDNGGGGDTPVGKGDTSNKGELTPPPASNQESNLPPQNVSQDSFNTFMLQQQAQALQKAQLESRTRMFESSSVGEPSKEGLTPQGELDNTGRPLSRDEIQEIIGKGLNPQTGYGESMRDNRATGSNLNSNQKLRMGGLDAVSEGLKQGATLLTLGGALGGLHNLMGNPFSTPAPEIPVEEVVEGVSLDADLADEIRQEQNQDLAEEKSKAQQDEMTRQIDEMSKAYGKGLILGMDTTGGKVAMGIDTAVSSLVGMVGAGERAYQSLQETQKKTQEDLVREQDLTAQLRGRIDTIEEQELMKKEAEAIKKLMKEREKQRIQEQRELQDRLRRVNPQDAVNDMFREREKLS